MTIIKTPAHLLKPGDTLPFLDNSGARFVVLCAARAEPGPVGLQLGRLGEIPAHLDRVATFSWPPMELVDVESDLTPVQAAANDLAECGRQIVADHTPPDATDLPIGAPASVRWMRNMLRDLEPPTPPTLEEALAVLDKLCNDGAVGPQLNDAEKLLHRARVAGVLPRG